MVTLGDRQSGRVRGVAFWESEEALHASEDAASRIRGRVAEATGGTVASVENCEVSVFEVASAGPVSGVADTLGGVTDKLGGATGNLLGGQEKKR
jgi:hypothetical protein